MNLKEAFRYQNFLDQMMGMAQTATSNRTSAINTVKLHKRNEVNPEAQDITETVDKGEYIKNETALQLMCLLIKEKGKLTEAITAAKRTLSFDLDAMLDTVRYQRTAAKSIQYMLCAKPSKSVETGTGYKFNQEGNQTPYTYSIETTVTEDFNRDAAKVKLKTLLAAADQNSNAIEKAQVDTVVDYKPIFDVNDSFEDVVATFNSMPDAGN